MWRLFLRAGDDFSAALPLPLHGISRHALEIPAIRFQDGGTLASDVRHDRIIIHGSSPPNSSSGVQRTGRKWPASVTATLIATINDQVARRACGQKTGYGSLQVDRWLVTLGISPARSRFDIVDSAHAGSIFLTSLPRQVIDAAVVETPLGAYTRRFSWRLIAHRRSGELRASQSPGTNSSRAAVAGPAAGLPPAIRGQW